MFLDSVFSDVNNFFSAVLVAGYHYKKQNEETVISDDLMLFKCGKCE